MATSVSEDTFRVQAVLLEHFTTDVFKKLNVPDDDATLIASCLVGVDLRGVSSQWHMAVAAICVRVSRWVDEHPLPYWCGV